MTAPPRSRFGRGLRAALHPAYLVGAVLLAGYLAYAGFTKVAGERSIPRGSVAGFLALVVIAAAVHGLRRRRRALGRAPWPARIPAALLAVVAAAGLAAGSVGLFVTAGGRESASLVDQWASRFVTARIVADDPVFPGRLIVRLTGGYVSGFTLAPHFDWRSSDYCFELCWSIPECPFPDECSAAAGQTVEFWYATRPRLVIWDGEFDLSPGKARSGFFAFAGAVGCLVVAGQAGAGLLRRRRDRRDARRAAARHGGSPRSPWPPPPGALVATAARGPTSAAE